MSQVTELVAEYNEIEEQQRERLSRLYDLVAAQSGPRKLRFACFVWSNWPSAGDQVSISRGNALAMLQKRPIVEVVEGK